LTLLLGYWELPTLFSCPFLAPQRKTLGTDSRELHSGVAPRFPTFQVQSAINQSITVELFFPQFPRFQVLFPTTPKVLQAQCPLFSLPSHARCEPHLVPFRLVRCWSPLAELIWVLRFPPVFFFRSLLVGKTGTNLAICPFSPPFSEL